MKKEIIIMLTLIVTNIPLYFSQKCEVSKDPFSNEKVAKFIYKGGTVLFESKGNNLKFEIVINYDGELNVIIPKGTELLFKLANDETLKLVPLQMRLRRVR